MGVPAQVQRWQHWMDLSGAWMKKQLHDRHSRIMNVYKSKGFLAEEVLLDPDKTDIVVNSLFPNTDAVVSTIYARNPAPVVTPKRESYLVKKVGRGGGTKSVSGIEFAKLLRGIVQNDLKEIHFKEEAEQVVRDAYLDGFGVVESGWLPEFKTKEIPVEIAGEGGARQIRIDYAEHLVKARPFHFRVRPGSMRFPPGMTRLRRSPWFARFEKVPLDELLADTRLDGRAQKFLREHSERVKAVWGDDEHPNAGEGLEIPKELEDMADFRLVPRINIWSLKENRYMQIVPGMDDHFLFNDKMDKFWPADGYPLTFLVFNEDPDDIELPIPDIATYMDQIREREILRNKMANAVAESKKILLTETQDDDEKNAIKDAEGAEIVHTNDAQAYNLIDLSFFMREWLAYDQILTNDLVFLSAVNEFRAGIPTGELGSATEALKKDQGFMIKQARRSNRVRNWTTEVMRKHIQLRQNFTVGTDFAPVRLENGDVKFREFSKEEIQGEFDLDVEGNTNEPETPALDRQQAQEEFALLYGKPEIDSRKLIAKLMESRGSNPNDVLKGGVNKDALRLAQAEWAMMMMGNDIVPTEGEDHVTHIKVHISQLTQLQNKVAEGVAFTEQELKGAPKLKAHVEQTMLMLPPEVAEILRPARGPRQSRPDRPAQPKQPPGEAQLQGQAAASGAGAFDAGGA